MAGVTFAVDESVKKEPVEVSTATLEEHSTRILKMNEGLAKVPFKFLKIETSHNSPLVNAYYQNGFVGAALSAYSQHHRLIISPDDVWIAITTAFGRFVEHRADEFRQFFVQHEGKKELKVTDVGNLKSVNWEKLIEEMSIKIKENTVGDIREWIEPNFSTTTPLIKTVGSIVLMGALKNYFAYKFELCCGLPEVTLLGTLDDWIEIRRRADRLDEFGIGNLSDWHYFLTPVLDQFISAYKGEVDKKFWNRIVNQIGGGSGPRYLSGWILMFVPFNEKGKFQLNPTEEYEWGIVNKKDVVPSTVYAPVTIDDNGTEYNTLFYAGHLSAVQSDDDPTAIQSNLGWFMLHLE